jgi:hypothetical protein
MDASIDIIGPHSMSPLGYISKYESGRFTSHTILKMGGSAWRVPLDMYSIKTKEKLGYL